MVVINKDNFLQELPGIEAALQRGKFVSFDLEMTGIFGERNAKDDDVEERYLKMIPPATKYGIIQIGLSFFEQVDGGGFLASPYSFFVFPEWGPDLVLSPSSITFLKKNNMDFNSWIYGSLSFMNEQNAKKMRDQLAQRTGAGGDQQPSSLMPNRPAEIQQMNELKEQISQWAASSSGEVEFEVPAMNAFLRRCVYSYLEIDQPQLRTRKDESKPNNIIVCKVTEEQKAALAVEEENKNKLKLGFRLVWEMLLAANKPIVGHNSFFDLLFLLRWLDGPLAGNFQTFKSRFNTLFPAGIYDTKFISNSSGAAALPGFDASLDDTALGPLYEKVINSNPETAKLLSFASPVFEYKAEDKQAHDAGYDAYMTGAIFAAALSKLGDEAAKTTWLNKMYLMQSLYNFSLGPDNEPNNSLRITSGDVWHLSAFAEDTKTQDIEAAFRAAGGGGGGRGGGGGGGDNEVEVATPLVETVWINGSSAFVVLKAGAATNTETLPQGWKLIPLAEFEQARALRRAPPPAAAAAEQTPGAVAEPIDQPKKKAKVDTCGVL